MKYVEIQKTLSKNKFQEEEKNADSEKLCLLLYKISCINDWEWVQNTYIRYLSHQDKWVKIAAIRGFSEIARCTHNLEKNKVLSQLKNIVKDDTSLEEIVQETIDDIELFL